MKRKIISVITPCFNEESNVEICAAELRNVMESQLAAYDYEHIFADNASTDKTFLLLLKMAELDSHIKVIQNSRNVGPFRSMWNAMKSASGDAVIPLLPADMQDPPSVIPEFVAKWESGDLIVYGVRATRDEALIMRFARGLYYRIIHRFASAVIPMNSGEFLLADRRVIDSIISIDDEYPYIRGRIAQTGVRASLVPYTWIKRKHGKSKNSFIQLVDQAINGFVSTSKIPARIALLFGFFISVLGIFGAFFSFIGFLLGRDGVSHGVPLIIVSVFLFGGLQLFFIGLLGEYILSIHGQVRKDPPMFEMQKINF
jgi:glycosyltransferase involved in cell wall biosynthesis